MDNKYYATGTAVGETIAPVQNYEIKHTTDYDKFKFLGSNRGVVESHVKKLKKSMRENPLVVPIIVNEKGEIIDGQHRFTASKELGIPVYYFVVPNYGIKEVQRANTNSVNWSAKDRMDSFVAAGEEEYIKFNKMTLKHELRLEYLIMIFAKIQNMPVKSIKYEFNNGTFTTEGADEVKEFFEDLELFKEFKKYRTRSFILAFSELYFHENYDHDRMVKKFEMYSAYLKECRTKVEYLNILCNLIYSAGSKLNNILYNTQKKMFH